MMQRFGVLVLVTLAAPLGCSTHHTSNTARTGLEQLLISNAVDQSLNEIDFAALRGSRVFLDEKYLDGVDKNYVIGTIRHRILNGGAGLAAKAEDSDVTIEIRSGGIGTDKKETFVGIPQISVPVPLPIQLPEVRLFTTTTQYGTAKIGLVAYETKTRQLIQGGGISLARSDDNKMYFLGIGPLNHGSVREELFNRQRATATRGASGLNFAGWPNRTNGPIHAGFKEAAPTGDSLLP